MSEKPPQADPEWIEWINHTADAGFRVAAPTLETLFERAAWAMFAILSEPGRARPVDTEEVRAEADDLEALMVRWLSELNYLHQTRRRIYGQFRTLSLTLEPPPARLAAEAAGEPIDVARLPVYCEIKAVTYHGIRVERNGEIWTARVIFDL